VIERIGPARASTSASSSTTPPLWYHLTSRSKFKLDPTFTPEDNAFAIEDRSGQPGIYLAHDVEPWLNGYGYWRPFVVELQVDPSVATDPGVHGRYGKEMFVPAASFGKLRILRVIPLDAYAREVYGEPGWIEDSLGVEFDTGQPIARGQKYRGYRYPGQDVRQMPAADVERLKRQLRQVKGAQGVRAPDSADVDFERMSDTDLEAMPIEVLDRAAFGVAEGDKVTLRLDEIVIRYPGDLEGAESEIRTPADARRHLAVTTDPVDVSFHLGRFELEDGHHRYVAHTILRDETIDAVVVRVRDNPVVAIRRKYGIKDTGRTAHAARAPESNRRVWSLIRKYNGVSILFRDLPRPAQLAIVHYMVVDSDGGAWGKDLPEWTDSLSVPQLKAQLPKLLPYLTDRYGDRPFGYVTIPMRALTESVMQDEDIGKDYRTFDEYHRAFIKQGDMPKHVARDPWPVILDTQNNFETLQDGWHRFHRYYGLGMQSVPAIYYLPNVKYLP